MAWRSDHSKKGSTGNCGNVLGFVFVDTMSGQDFYLIKSCTRRLSQRRCLRQLISPMWGRITPATCKNQVLQAIFNIFFVLFVAITYSEAEVQKAKDHRSKLMHVSQRNGAAQIHVKEWINKHTELLQVVLCMFKTSVLSFARASMSSGLWIGVPTDPIVFKVGFNPADRADIYSDQTLA